MSAGLWKQNFLVCVYSAGMKAVEQKYCNSVKTLTLPFYKVVRFIIEFLNKLINLQ